MLRAAGVVVLILLGATAVWGSLTITPSYEECDANYEKHYTDPEKGNHGQIANRTIAGRFEVFVRCGGEVLHANNGTIQAVSAFIVMLLTIVLGSIAYVQLRHSRKMERAYLTSGGDFEERDGWKAFRLDIENHGKTPALVTGYDVRFAVLKQLVEEFPTARPVCERFRHKDGISPGGARKLVYTGQERNDGDDVVYGAVWYTDIWGDRYKTRFILRIAETNDIPKHGITRLNVRGVGKDYSRWDEKLGKQSYHEEKAR